MRTVFISYRHENDGHAAAVRRFAERLRAAHLPVELDQFYVDEHPAGPDEGWPKWCRDRAVKSECVLVIASPGWFSAYEMQDPPAIGLGAAEEARIFNQALFNDKGFNPRIRFVLIDTSGTCQFPLGLDAWHKFQPTSRPADFSQIVAWIQQKLSIAERAEDPKRILYLADCLIDSDGLREGLAEELSVRGWRVLPERIYSNQEYAVEAARDIRRSVAFVQLLQPNRWKGLDHDHVQYQQAIQIGIPNFRFRDPDLDCSKISDAPHRTFLTSDPNILVRPFDQFKKELFEGLDALWDRLHQPPPSSGNQPKN